MSSTKQHDTSPSPSPPPPPPSPRPAAPRSTSFSMPSSMPTSSAPTLALTLEPASPSSSTDTLAPFSRPPTPSSRPRTPSSRPRTPSSRPRTPAVRSASWAPASTMPTPALSRPSTPSTWASPSSTVIATPSTPSPSLPSVSRTSSSCSSVVAAPQPIRPTSSDRKLLESQLLSSLGRIVALVSVKDRESELFRTKRHLRALIANLESAAHAAAAQQAHLHRHGRGMDPRRASFSKAEAKLKVGAGGRLDATELARQLDDERANTATLQGDLANALQEVAILNGYTDELSLELEKQNEENALLRNVIKGHAASEAELRAELSARMAQEKQRDRDELNGLRDENIRLSLEVSAGTARHESLSREADALRVDKAALTREVAELRTANTALKQEVIDLKEHAEDMADDVRRQAEHDIACLQAELGATQDAAQAAELELEALHVAHAELQDAYGEDAAIIASKDAALASVTADLQEREAEVAQLVDKRDWLRGRLAAQAEAGMRHNALIHRPMAEKLASLAAEVAQLRGGNTKGPIIKVGDGPADACPSDKLDAALRDNTAATARFLDAFQAYTRDVRDVDGLALRVASDVGRRLVSLVGDDHDDDHDEYFDCMSVVGDLEETSEVHEIQSPTAKIVGTLYTADESDTDVTDGEDPNEADPIEVRAVEASIVVCETGTDQVLKAERDQAPSSEAELHNDQLGDGPAQSADLDLPANYKTSAPNDSAHSPRPTADLKPGNISSAHVSSDGMGDDHAPETAPETALEPAHTNPDTANSVADTDDPSPKTPTLPGHDGAHSSDVDVPDADVTDASPPRPRTTPDSEADNEDVPVPKLPAAAPATIEELLAGVEAEAAYWRDVGRVYNRHRQASLGPDSLPEEEDGGVRQMLSPRSLGVELREDKADAPRDDPEAASTEDPEEAAGTDDLDSESFTPLSSPDLVMVHRGEDGPEAATDDTEESGEQAASQPATHGPATDVPGTVRVEQEETIVEAAVVETGEVDREADVAADETSGTPETSGTFETSGTLESANIESANIESANIESTTIEITTIESATIESTTIQCAMIESVTIKSVPMESANLESGTIDSANIEAVQSINAPGETVETTGDTVAAGPPTPTEPAPAPQADPTSPPPPPTTKSTGTAGSLDPPEASALEQVESRERENQSLEAVGIVEV